MASRERVRVCAAVRLLRRRSVAFYLYEKCIALHVGHARGPKESHRFNDLLFSKFNWTNRRINVVQTFSSRFDLIQPSVDFRCFT